MQKKVWGYRPVDYRTWPSLLVPQIQILSINLRTSANSLKFHFSNKNGVSPLLLTDLTLKVFRADKLILERDISFTGRHEINLDIDDQVLSDEVVFPFKDIDCLQISAVIPKKTYLTSGVVTYSQLNMHVDNFSLQTGRRIQQFSQFQMVKSNPRMTCFYGLDAIYADVDANVLTVSVFGDSITQQGFYVNHLRSSLNDEGERQYGVCNLGIGGNRILYDTDPMFDVWYRHGIAGIKRFESDLFPKNVAVPDVVFVFHGINDVIQETIHPGDTEKVSQIIKGLELYAKTLEKKNVISLIGTLLPMKNSIFYSKSVENKREEVNEWIRTQKIFTDFVDLERVVKDSNDSQKLAAEYDSGDGLHPNDTAGAVIGKAIADKIFQLS